MNRISALAIAATATIASLAGNATPALAGSGPVTVTTVQGPYETVLTCPSLSGPAGAIKPLLATPLMPQNTKAAAAATAASASRNTHYSPIVTCTVTFLKDSPPVTHKAGLCSRTVSVRVHGQHRNRTVAACCARAKRHAGPVMPACFVLNTGFGGMAEQVSRHRVQHSR